LKKIRSLRNTLATKTRESLFATFGELRLPFINSNAGPQEITTWKNSSEVADCYKNLFVTNNTDSQSTLSLIIAKIFNCKSYSNAEFAFVVAVCKILLNPKYDTLQLKEPIMKSKVKRYMVGFVIL
jgi:hypothetical protein